MLLSASALQVVPLQSAGVALFLALVVALVALGLVYWTCTDARTNSSHPAFLWALVVFLAPLLELGACYRQRHVQSGRVRKVCPTPAQSCKMWLRSTTS